MQMLRHPHEVLSSAPKAVLAGRSNHRASNNYLPYVHPQVRHKTPDSFHCGICSIPPPPPHPHRAACHSTPAPVPQQLQCHLTLAAGARAKAGAVQRDDVCLHSHLRGRHARAIESKEIHVLQSRFVQKPIPCSHSLTPTSSTASKFWFPLTPNYCTVFPLAPKEQICAQEDFKGPRLCHGFEEVQPRPPSAVAGTALRGAEGGVEGYEVPPEGEQWQPPAAKTDGDNTPPEHGSSSKAMFQGNKCAFKHVRVWRRTI